VWVPMAVPATGLPSKTAVASPLALLPVLDQYRLALTTVAPAGMSLMVIVPEFPPLSRLPRPTPWDDSPRPTPVVNEDWPSVPSPSANAVAGSSKSKSKIPRIPRRSPGFPRGSWHGHRAPVGGWAGPDGA